jgi:thiol-disulfide isomerase/thioredoxin
MSAPSAALQMFFFTSPTCGPCKAVKPVVAELREDNTQITWVEVNTAADPSNFATTYKVTHVPTMVAIKNGTEVGRHSGTQMMGYFALTKRLTASK